MSNSSIWPIGRTLSGFTTLGQSGHQSNGREGVYHIPQNSSITEASPPDCLVSYQDTCWEEVLPLCRDAVAVFYSPSQLGWGGLLWEFSKGINKKWNADRLVQNLNLACLIHLFYGPHPTSKYLVKPRKYVWVGFDMSNF